MQHTRRFDLVRQSEGRADDKGHGRGAEGSLFYRSCEVLAARLLLPLNAEGDAVTSRGFLEYRVRFLVERGAYLRLGRLLREAFLLQLDNAELHLARKALGVFSDALFKIGLLQSSEAYYPYFEHKEDPFRMF